ASSAGLPQENSLRSWARASRSMTHSAMVLLIALRRAARGGVRRRRICQGTHQTAGIALRQAHRHPFLRPVEVVRWNHFSLAHAILVVADGFEYHGGIRKARQTDPAFVVSNAHCNRHFHLPGNHSGSGAWWASGNFPLRFARRERKRKATKVSPLAADESISEIAYPSSKLGSQPPRSAEERSFSRARFWFWRTRSLLMRSRWPIWRRLWVPLPVRPKRRSSTLRSRGRKFSIRKPRASWRSELVRSV